MNYLAHIFFSGKNNQIQIGNFIGDFVKGSAHTSYPDNIAEGILLHRKIDHFTDQHEITRNLKNMLRPEFGRYSGIVADMYLDHYLAINFKQFSGLSLRWFAFKFYFTAITYYRHLPVRVKGFIFHFIFTNRLNSYASINGLHESLNIMAIHKTNALQPDKIINFYIKNTRFIEPLLKDLLCETKIFTKDYLKNLNH